MRNTINEEKLTNFSEKIDQYHDYEPRHLNSCTNDTKNSIDEELGEELKSWLEESSMSTAWSQRILKEC